jgi:hypothetical protein
MNAFKKAFALLGLTLLALICGCTAVRSQPVVNVPTFHPPPGWQIKEHERKVKGLILAGVWSSGGNPPETISLGYGAIPEELRTAAKLNSYDVVKLGPELDRLSEGLGTKVVSSRAVTLCNGKAKGWETVTSATLLGIQMNTEAVFLLSPSLFASVTYTRSSGSQRSDAAERALRTLCI